MAIKVGDTLPSINFKVLGEDGPEEISSESIFANKKVVVFALPGAFTPTCNANHLPGYLDHVEDFKAKGVDEIVVISVNDVWVMNAWAEASNGKGKILFLSDGALEFTKAVGMEVDLSMASMGMRSSRYSMLVDNYVVKTINAETSRGLDVSDAATMIGQL